MLLISHFAFHISHLSLVPRTGIESLFRQTPIYQSYMLILSNLQKPDKLTTLDRLKLTTLLPTQIDHPFFC